MIALILASVAVILAFISLTATGAIAVKLRLATPRDRHRHGDQPEELTIPTLGRPIREALGATVEVTIPTADGPATVVDAYLLDDGPILVASTTCGTCRYLIQEAVELLRGTVRLLVVAPSLARGIEFVERDCQATGVSYQVDELGQRVLALGLTESPCLLTVADGAIAAAYSVITAAQLSNALDKQKTPIGEKGTAP